MGWKIFAIVSCCLLVASFVYDGIPTDPIQLASIPITAIADVGLVAYAFRISALHGKWWAHCAGVFAAWSVLVLSVGVTRGMTNAPTYAIILATVFVAAYSYAHWLALYRLGSGVPAGSNA
jgi:hypothetical protein